MTYDVQIIVEHESNVERIQKSDLPTIFKKVGVTWQCLAPRNPQELNHFVQKADSEGTMVFICVARKLREVSQAVNAAQALKPLLGVILANSVFLSEIFAPEVPIGYSGEGEKGLKLAAHNACAIVGTVKPEVRKKIRLLSSDKQEGA